MRLVVSERLLRLSLDGLVLLREQHTAEIDRYYRSLQQPLAAGSSMAFFQAALQGHECLLEEVNRSIQEMLMLLPLKAAEPKAPTSPDSVG